MLGDDINSALPELRAQAESRMTETVVVGLYEDGTDPDTGDATRALVTERYQGKGRIRWASRDVTSHDGPGAPVTVQEPYLSVPHGTVRLPVGDEVHVPASESEPLFIGMVFRIAGVPTSGQVTSHRYALEELS
jgi:hypothetical protein